MECVVQTPPSIPGVWIMKKRERSRYTLELGRPVVYDDNINQFKMEKVIFVRKKPYPKKQQV
jgi:CRISPR/Cas system-associated protein Cas7 (RAMP superfamily)